MGEEDFRRAIVDSAPDLYETAFEADSKEFRSLLFDMAAEYILPEDELADEEKRALRLARLKNLKPYGDVFVESGIKGLATVKLQQRIVDLSSAIGTLDMSAPWTSNAQRQLKRYGIAIKNKSLKASQRAKLGVVLNFLKMVESDNDDSLRSEVLIYFIARLEKELDQSRMAEQNNEPESEPADDLRMFDQATITHAF